MKAFSYIFTIITSLVLSTTSVFGQTKITGKVSDKSGEALIGANVFIENSYDGASTDENGEFSFTTYDGGKKTLVISYIGYVEKKLEIDLNGQPQNFTVKLAEQSNELNSVIITAGAFEASDKKKGVTLKPLDIVTTPNADGDIYGALKTLPGAQTSGDDGRLFVRGGEYYETKTFIDGMLVQEPYISKMPDIPSRGRFSPMLFTGTLFSSGGYSAEYGQAMSSALILNTEALPENTFTSLSFMSIGTGLGHTMRNENSSISLSYDYFNMAPYINLIDTDIDYVTKPNGHSGMLIGRKKIGENGFLKIMSTASTGETAFQYPDFENDFDKITYSSLNDNVYINSVYTDKIGEWRLKAGASYTYNKDKTGYGELRFNEEMNSGQVRITLARNVANGVKIKFGSESVFHEFYYNLNGYNDIDGFKQTHLNVLPANFAEAEIQLPSKFAARVGLRHEYSNLNTTNTISPRVSLAYKINDNSQLSFAYGDFYQSPQDELLKFKNNLEFEKATHYIANYQFKKDDKTFRVEAYKKQYSSLVKFDREEFYNPDLFSNSGNGYAQGVDVFWRQTNRQTNIDYWISYSYIDSKRNYRDYPETAQPGFIANHHLSIVAKKYVIPLHTQFGISYQYTSGRPYYNPNNPDFMSDRVDDFSEVSMNLSYLTSIADHFTIVYFAVSNLGGKKHTYGYHYNSEPNSEGIYDAYTIKSDAKRFLVLGIFVTIE